jgi:hypothetical protein
MKQGSSWKLAVASQGMSRILWNPRGITIEQVGVVVTLSTCVPVTTAWRVLGLRMEERPPVMEGSCEYIE